MGVFDEFRAAERELRLHATAASFRVDRGACVFRKQQRDATAGGRKIAAAIDAHFGAYAASGSVGLDSSIATLEVDAAARGVYVKITPSIVDVDTAAGRSQLGRSIDPLGIDVATGCVSVDLSSDVANGDAAAGCL